MRQYLSIFTIFRKDVLCQTRSAVTIISVPFFALLVVIIFAFTFNTGSSESLTGNTAASILWIAFTFAAVIGLSQTFVAEKENSCLKGLLLCPIDRHVIYLGKLIGSLGMIFFAEAVTTPVFILLFGVSWRIIDLAVIIFLATLGLAVVGTLLSAISSASRMREVLFPILFFPIIIPLVIASVAATGSVFEGHTLGDALSWINILIAFDVLFIAISILIFESTIEGS